MTSQENQIELFYNQGEYPQVTLTFNETDRVVDLRKELAERNGIDEGIVTLHQAFLKLDDEKLVKDLLRNDIRISYSLNPSVTIIPDEDIWVIRNKDWNRLIKNNEEFLDLKETMRYFSTDGWGQFAIARNEIKGNENRWEARVFKVKNDWKIRVEVTKQTGDDGVEYTSVNVFRVDNGEKVEQIDLLTFDRNQKGWFEMALEFARLILCRGIPKVTDLVGGKILPVVKQGAEVAGNIISVVKQGAEAAETIQALNKDNPV